MGDKCVSKKRPNLCDSSIKNMSLKLDPNSQKPFNCFVECFVECFVYSKCTIFCTSWGTLGEFISHAPQQKWHFLDHAQITNCRFILTTKWLIDSWEAAFIPVDSMPLFVGVIAVVIFITVSALAIIIGITCSRLERHRNRDVKASQPDVINDVHLSDELNYQSTRGDNRKEFFI